MIRHRFMLGELDDERAPGREGQAGYAELSFNIQRASECQLLLIRLSQRTTRCSELYGPGLSGR